ncbi:FAD-dependent monooxygenase [Rhodococcus qingshengii]|uniref:FAD-dependent monooxygenase n=1 Tax=Rhodococcus qingshengii TaxID=334542 RepID=UPI003F4D50A7
MIVVGVGIIDATEPTGIGDADNLAWKLASVIRGDAGPALLDTYEVERRRLPSRSSTSPAAIRRLRVAIGSTTSCCWELDTVPLRCKRTRLMGLRG